jgi:sugar lactone lactonase YvrE
LIISGIGTAPRSRTKTALLLSAASYTNAGAYVVVVTNLYGTITSAVAAVTVGIPPGITDQTGSQVNPLGSTAAFSVAVSGPGPFTYQWQFEGTNLPDGIITTAAGDGTAGGFGDGGAATNAELYFPQGAAVDAFGNLFIADTDNQRIRELGTDGILTTVAGNGTVSYSGDGGGAIDGELNSPTAVAVDAFGNLFIADSGNNVIRKVRTDGIITTMAGSGTNGYSGDGSAATKAELANPQGVTLDASGNLFIADSGNNVIREVGTNGIITTVAGNGTQGYSGDGGPATKGELSNPTGVAVDASGNLFIADSGNNRVRKVVFPGSTLVLNNVGGANTGEYDVVVSSPYGSVTSSVVTLLVLLPPTIVTQPQSQGVALGSNSALSLAATGTVPLDYQWYFDGAPLQGQTNTTLLLSAAAYSDAGSYNVVVANLYGSVTSAVAVLSVGFPPGITAQPMSQTNLFNSTAAFSVAVSGTGHFSYQWQFDGTNLTDGIITTVAGDGSRGYSGDGGAATKAELYYPNGVAVDASGNLFIADVDNSVIRELGTDGIITTVAGNGTQGSSGDGGPATKAELLSPAGVAVDAFGNLFIADRASQRIRKVTTDGIITTVAGNGTQGYSGDGGPATKAELLSPAGVAVDAFGNLFIADTWNQRIRKVGTNGIITTVAGDGYTNLSWLGGYSGDGGRATNAELNVPSGVAVDGSGNLFIADSSNSRVRKVGTNGIITTVAGGGPNYPGDGGAATNAELNAPTGVAVDASGNLFIADTFWERIREVGTDGIVTTVVGNGSTGYSGDSGAATDAELWWPADVAVDASGDLFIADTYNMRVRKVMLGGPALVLSHVSGANAGAYDLVVSSPYGSVTSSVVTLVVALNPLNALSIGGQEVQLQFQGVAGNSYVLLSATNLTPPVDWRPVITNAADTSGNWTFTVTNVFSDKAMFYRYRTSTAGQ